MEGRDRTTLLQQHSSALPSLIIVAFLWGFTNPFIRRAAAADTVKTASLAQKESSSEQRKKSLLSWFQQQAWWRLAFNWRFVLPLALNLSGSAVYYRLLGDAGRIDTCFGLILLRARVFIMWNTPGLLPMMTLTRPVDLSLAVPISNSLTFALTLLAGYLLGEEFGSPRVVAGIGLVFVGIIIMILSKEM